MALFFELINFRRIFPPFSLCRSPPSANSLFPLLFLLFSAFSLPFCSSADSAGLSSKFLSFAEPIDRDDYADSAEHFDSLLLGTEGTNGVPAEGPGEAQMLPEGRADDEEQRQDGEREEWEKEEKEGKRSTMHGRAKDGREEANGSDEEEEEKGDGREKGRKGERDEKEQRLIHHPIGRETKGDGGNGSRTNTTTTQNTTTESGTSSGESDKSLLHTDAEAGGSKSKEGNATEEGPNGTTERCHPKLDLVFLLDTSGSIEQLYREHVRWAVSLVESLPLERDTVRVAAVQYAGFPLTEFALGTYPSADDIRQHFRRMKFQAGGTRTGYALRKAESELFRPDRGARADAGKVIVLFTDGLSIDDPLKPAKQLREHKNVKIFIVSIFDDALPFHAELNRISGKEENIFGPGPEELERLRTKLLTEAERAQACIRIGDRLPFHGPMGGHSADKVTDDRQRQQMEEETLIGERNRAAETPVDEGEGRETEEDKRVKEEKERKKDKEQRESKEEKDEMKRRDKEKTKDNGIGEEKEQIREENEKEQMKKREERKKSEQKEENGKEEEEEADRIKGKKENGRLKTEEEKKREKERKERREETKEEEKEETGTNRGTEKGNGNGTLIEEREKTLPSPRPPSFSANEEKREQQEEEENDEAKEKEEGHKREEDRDREETTENTTTAKVIILQKDREKKRSKWHGRTRDKFPLENVVPMPLSIGHSAASPAPSSPTFPPSLSAPNSSVFADNFSQILKNAQKKEDNSSAVQHRPIENDQKKKNQSESKETKRKKDTEKEEEEEKEESNEEKREGREGKEKEGKEGEEEKGHFEAEEEAGEEEKGSGQKEEKHHRNRTLDEAADKVEEGPTQQKGTEEAKVGQNELTHSDHSPTERNRQGQTHPSGEFSSPLNETTTESSTNKGQTKTNGRTEQTEKNNGTESEGHNDHPTFPFLSVPSVTEQMVPANVSFSSFSSVERADDVFEVPTKEEKAGREATANTDTEGTTPIPSSSAGPSADAAPFSPAPKGSELAPNSPRPPESNLAEAANSTKAPEEKTEGEAKGSEKSGKRAKFAKKANRKAFGVVAKQQQSERQEEQLAVHCPSLDVLFIVDSSGSVQRVYEQQKRWLEEILCQIQLEEPEKGPQVALIQFAGAELQKTEWGWNRFRNSEQMMDAFHQVRHLTGTTFIGRALQQAAQLLERRRRPVPALVVLLSDGFSQDEAFQSAQNLRSMANTQFFALSISELSNTDYLHRLTANPSHVFIGTTGADLLRAQILRRIRCGE